MNDSKTQLELTEAEKSMLEAIKSIDKFEIVWVSDKTLSRDYEYRRFKVNKHVFTEDENNAFIKMCGIIYDEKDCWPVVYSELMTRTNTFLCGVSKVKSRKQLDMVIKTLDGRIGHNFNLNWLDVSKIEDMSMLFYDSEFHGDISKWNVSNVKNMNSMFQRSYFNDDLSEWDVSHVEDMSYMFAGGNYYTDFNRNNLNISNWNVSNVKKMDSMFMNTLFNSDISKWDVSNVKSMRSMFSDSSFNKNISNWDVSNVTDMAFMFENSGTLYGDVDREFAKLKRKGLASGEYWPKKTSYDWKNFGNFRQDISRWDISKVESTKGMFKNCYVHPNIIAKWGPTCLFKIKDKEDMFKNSKICL